MASYLSYFSSVSSSSAPAQQAAGPAGGGSTWSSTFSSRISNLRKALTRDSEEDDPDNEDCSHISNVLRAYYGEKGRALPEWLPPDPKKPIAPPPQPLNQYGQYASAYGNQYGTTGQHARGPSGGRGGGLSDLWDSSPSQAAPAPALQSLRRPILAPQSIRPGVSARSQSGGGEGGSGQSTPFGGAGNSSARPLPSQKTGSYQATPSASQGALGSRDRLRARLQGSSSGRSSPSAGLPGGGGGSGGGFGVPANGGSGTGSFQSGASQPYISASEPWSTGGDPYSGYDPGYASGLSSKQYGGQEYRQRPGGPR